MDALRLRSDVKSSIKIVSLQATARRAGAGLLILSLLDDVGTLAAWAVSILI